MTGSPRTEPSSDPVIVDLVNDQAAVTAFKGVGLKTGEELTGDGITEISFALSMLVPMIPSAGQAGPDTYHTFTLMVADKNGIENEWSLKFHVPAN